MLQIRSEQYEVLAQAGLRRFESEAVQHMQEQWPEVYAQEGPEGALGRVRETIAGAREAGISERYDVLRLLNMGCAFEESFAEFAARPWVKKSLDRVEEDGTARVDQLAQRAMQQLQAEEAEA